jgi:hypothetical protein
MVTDECLKNVSLQIKQLADPIIIKSQFITAGTRSSPPTGYILISQVKKIVKF